MIGRIMERAPRAALVRVVRAFDIAEWGPHLCGSGSDWMPRNLVGHLEAWRERDDGMFGIEPADAFLDDSERNLLRARWARLYIRAGPERAVSLVQRKAKQMLGKRPW